jgi:hypothetical protein
MDNGTPWGTQSRLPSALGLWLVGLGIDLIYGRPRRSTDNAIVERDHGVLAQWVEAQHCLDFQHCQQQLDWAVLTQRERYRSPNGYTRAQAFPDLFAKRRIYVSDQDSLNWSDQRVALYLSGFTFHRKVEINGRVTLFANSYSLGKRYARQSIQITFDPNTYEWCFSDELAHCIRRHPTKELFYEPISQLQLAKRHRP